MAVKRSTIGVRGFVLDGVTFAGDWRADAPQTPRLFAQSPIPSPQDVFTGTEGSDFLEGTAGSDTIDGLGGNDFLRGLDGDDVVNGGAGTDVVEGGSNGPRDLTTGNDTLNGGDGDDFLKGGPGVDFYDGGAGFDRISFVLTGATQGVVASLATQTISNDGFGNSETFTSVEALGNGTIFADSFTGDDAVNLLFGETGDILSANGGDDFFFLGAAPASVHGGAGNDTIAIFSLAKLVPDNTGDGFADLSFATHGISVDLSLQIISDDGFGGAGAVTNVENVGGSTLDDVLVGDASDNGLSGFSGSDQLTGGLGADLLNGAAGADTLNGGHGNDILLGAGASGISLGAGFVVRAPGAGSVDIATALDISHEFAGLDPTANLQVQATTDGADHVYRIDLFNVGAVLTVSLSSAGSVRITDAAGNFFASGSLASPATFTVSVPANVPGAIGGAAAFYITVSTAVPAGQQYFLGVNVASELDFSSDILNGGAGDDALTGGAGADALNGGGGVDTADYSVSATGAGVTINLNAVTGTGSGGDAEGDTLVSVENVIGTAFDDVLTGRDFFANTLNGGAGDDVLSGGTGGADVMNGGAGVDTLDYSLSPNGVDVRLFSGAASGGSANGDSYTSIEYIRGSATKTDTLAGDAGTNVIWGGGGNETITGREGADLLFGEAGNDTLLGGADNDVLLGGAGADTLGGGAGNDYVVYAESDAGVTINLQTGLGSGGHAQGDVLVSIENVTGSGFDDIIIGKTSLWNNIFDGSTGNDTYTGGLGNDTFVFRAGEGNDTITDFSAVGAGNNDAVQLASFGPSFDTFAEVIAAASQAGADVVLNLGGQTLTLQNVTLASLTSADFIFG